VKEQIMTEETTVNSLVAIYIQMRNAIKAKEAEHEAEIAALKEDFDTISAKLLELCNEQNADSIKTAAGTVSRRVSSRYWTSDWESMHRFILEHEAPFLLEQRIHNGNMRQFLDENPEDFPMGLQADNKFVIQVRKPTAK
jgi:hypothetical protein